MKKECNESIILEQYKQIITNMGDLTMLHSTCGYRAYLTMRGDGILCGKPSGTVERAIKILIQTVQERMWDTINTLEKKNNEYNKQRTL